MAALAENLGITTRRVTQLRQAGMPVDSIAAAKSWRDTQAERQQGKIDSAEELRQRRIALLRQQERRAKIDADERAKLLIPIADVDERDSRIGFAVRGALMMLEHHLPPMLAGLHESQIAVILHGELRRVLEQLADGKSEWWATYSPVAKTPA